MPYRFKKKQPKSRSRGFSNAHVKSSNATFLYMLLELNCTSNLMSWRNLCNIQMFINCLTHGGHVVSTGERALVRTQHDAGRKEHVVEGH